MKKMTPEEVRVQWLAALRSGDFKQAKSYLRKSKNSFCCLGVLCELYRETEGEGRSLWKHEKSVGLLYAPDHFSFGITNKRGCLLQSSESFLPEEVRRWVGLSLDDMRKLASMNDSGSSFREIAETIDRDLEVVG